MAEAALHSTHEKLYDDVIRQKLIEEFSIKTRWKFHA